MVWKRRSVEAAEAALKVEAQALRGVGTWRNMDLRKTRVIIRLEEEAGCNRWKKKKSDASGFFPLVGLLPAPPERTAGFQWTATSQPWTLVVVSTLRRTPLNGFRVATSSSQRHAVNAFEATSRCFRRTLEQRLEGVESSVLLAK